MVLIQLIDPLMQTAKREAMRGQHQRVAWEHRFVVLSESRNIFNGLLSGCVACTEMLVEMRGNTMSPEIIARSVQ